MKKYIPHLIIVALLIFGIHNCERAGFYKSNGDANAAALTDSLKHFKNALGKETASRQTLQLDKKQLQSILTDKDAEMAAMAKEFAKVHSVTKITTITKFDTLGIKFDTPIVMLPGDTLGRFERKGVVLKPWFKLGYKVNNDSLVIAPFETWTDTRIVTGVKRKWFLGKETVVTDVTNSNPYISVTGLTGAEVNIVAPWYKKWYFWLIAGAATGFFIAK